MISHEGSRSVRKARKPDATAQRVALWRALHVEHDDPPHVLTDDLGLRLLNPGTRWHSRRDMGLSSARNRAAVVARSRLAEDIVIKAHDEGVLQYVVLGAGLDTFAQRIAPTLAGLRVWEVDQPDTQIWKLRRLQELDLPHDQLVMTAMDLEQDDRWLRALTATGFDPAAPAIVSALGLTQYLTPPATAKLMEQTAALAAGSRLVLSIALDADSVEPSERAVLRQIERGTASRGHPWISQYAPADIAAMARIAGLHDVTVLQAAQLTERYFVGRADGLRPSSIEAVLTASTGI